MPNRILIKYNKIKDWLNTQTDAIFNTPQESKQEWEDIWAELKTEKDIKNELWKQYCEYFVSRYYFNIEPKTITSRIVKVARVGPIHQKKIRLLEKIPLETIKTKEEIQDLMHAWSIMYNYKLHNNTYTDVYNWFDYHNAVHTYSLINPLFYAHILTNYYKKDKDGKRVSLGGGNFDGVALKDSFSNLSLKF